LVVGLLTHSCGDMTVAGRKQRRVCDSLYVDYWCVEGDHNIAPLVRQFRYHLYYYIISEFTEFFVIFRSRKNSLS